MDQAGDVENIPRRRSSKNYCGTLYKPLLRCCLTCRHSSIVDKFSQMSKRVYYHNLLACSIDNRFGEAPPFAFQNTFKVVPFYSPYTYPSFVVSDSASLIH